MKKLLLTFFATTITTICLAAGISGNFNVGAGQTYTSLTNNSATGFFKYLNSLDGITNYIDGDITVTIVSDITIEDGAVALNALHYFTNGPYTITIVPDGAATRTVSGFYNGAKALINFNGAAYVTVDGRYNGTGNYLTFKNTAGAGSYATLYFEGDANNITVNYCTIQGAPLNTNQQFGPGYNGNDPSYIFIGNGVTTGNYNITFDHNNIGSNNYIDQCIIANSTTVNNHDITITNNNIFNFMDAGYTTNDYGIYITQSGTGSGSNWNISGNSFYATGVAGGAYSQEFIYFSPGTSSTGNSISNNFLGGNLPECGAGTSPAPGYFANNACCSSNYISNFIDVVNCGSITIAKNVIKNIRFTGGYGSMVLIKLQGATAATISGNRFGDADAAFRISTVNTNANAYIKGILNTSTGTVVVDSNQFINIWATGGPSFSAYVEHIIFTAASANSKITNNTFGYCQTIGSGSLVDNNFAINVSPVSGTMSNLIISGNDIQIPSAGTSNAQFNMGIFVHSGNTSMSATVSNNRIYDYQALSLCNIYGIYMAMTVSGTHNYTVANNEVILSNPAGAANVRLYGIADASCNGGGSFANYFNNSVYIGGSASGNVNSYCLFYNPCSNVAAGPTMNIRNNIFINGRSGGTGTHYSLYNSYSVAGWGAGSSDYNMLVSRGTLGYWQTANTATLTDWQASSGSDAHSKSAAWTAATSSFTGAPYPGTNTLNPSGLFTDVANMNLHIKLADGNSYRFVTNHGADLTSNGITTDYDGDMRCPNIGCAGATSSPDIGSDEFDDLSTGMHQRADEISLKLFPNPSSYQLTVLAPLLPGNEDVEISVVNVLGETMQQGKIKWKGDAIINLKYFPAGVYFLQLKSEAVSVVKSFVKD